MLRDVMVTINGRLGRDPESAQVQTKNGTQTVARISVAANTTFKNGEENETCWFSMTLWGKTAEYFLGYAQKGDGVFIVGELRPDPANGKPKLWTDKEGNVRSQWSVDNLQTCQLIQRGDGKRQARAGFSQIQDPPWPGDNQESSGGFNFTG